MPRQTRDQHLAGLEWNIDDATQALINAVGMRNWKSAKKSGLFTMLSGAYGAHFGT